MGDRRRSTWLRAALFMATVLVASACGSVAGPGDGAALPSYTLNPTTRPTQTTRPEETTTQQITTTATPPTTATTTTSPTTTTQQTTTTATPPTTTTVPEDGDGPTPSTGGDGSESDDGGPDEPAGGGGNGGGGNGCGDPPEALAADGRAQQVIVFTDPGSHSWPDASVELQACASSGLPVTFTISGESCNSTLEGVTARAGTPYNECTIVAHQEGDAQYAPAPETSHQWEVDYQRTRLGWSNVPGPLQLPQGETTTVVLTLTVSSAAEINGLGISIFSDATTCAPQPGFNVDGTRTATFDVPVVIVGPGECRITAALNAYYAVADSADAFVFVTGG